MHHMRSEPCEPELGIADEGRRYQSGRGCNSCWRAALAMAIKPERSVWTATGIQICELGYIAGPLLVVINPTGNG